MSKSFWRNCSSCKKEIPWQSPYYICSVSTCRQKKTDYAFCSVECWDQHIPIERHRSDAVSAIEKRSPRADESAESPKRIVVSAKGTQSASFEKAKLQPTGEVPTLVVVSKVKSYIADRSGMNCSASTMDALTERICQICDEAIQRAKADGRKTVMDRDVPRMSLLS